jgi:ribonuclease HII
VNQPASVICGIDEAGRGPLAGPVCAAAVILPPDFNVSILDDSKKMTEKRRNSAMKEIYLHASAWGVGWASADEIDSINILRASLLAMHRAFLNLRSKFPSVGPLTVIVDGLFCPEIDESDCSACPKADGTYPAVMAASILAKTARDRMMLRYSWLYPDYGYEKHKGYPTASHIGSLKKNGPSPIQRKSFHLKNEGQLGLF